MPTEQQIMERKRCWIGKTIPKPKGATERNYWTGILKVQE
jgi:hypothetical protein